MKLRFLRLYLYSCNPFISSQHYPYPRSNKEWKLVPSASLVYNIGIYLSSSLAWYLPLCSFLQQVHDYGRLLYLVVSFHDKICKSGSTAIISINLVSFEQIFLYMRHVFTLHYLPKCNAWCKEGKPKDVEEYLGEDKRLNKTWDLV